MPLYTFLQNRKKRTYMYESLQFPVEINTRGSKTLTNCIPFHISRLHMHEFSDSIGLLGNSRDTTLHLRDEELRYESRETTV